jgi:hypothetical protein
MSDLKMGFARAAALTFCALTLLGAGLLLVGDALPGVFPSAAHRLLASLPLVLVSITVLVFQVAQRAAPLEWGKALIVAVAFLSWAANQLCTDERLALLFNDFAIALFVLDVVLIIAGKHAKDGSRDQVGDSR